MQAKLTHAEQSGVSSPRINAARVAYYALAYRDAHEHLQAAQTPAPEHSVDQRSSTLRGALTRAEDLEAAFNTWVEQLRDSFPELVAVLADTCPPAGAKEDGEEREGTGEEGESGVERELEETDEGDGEGFEVEGLEDGGKERVEGDGGKERVEGPPDEERESE